jgi:predicted enzyme related to lactoylglutathione lyase
VVASGGKVVMPKMPIPGVGYLAYCQDTEENTFAIMQPDESAK